MKMLHPGLDRLRAFSDDELRGQTRGQVAAHLAECPTCRRELSILRDLKQAAREVTAVAVPLGVWQEILTRREAGEESILPMPEKLVAARRAVIPAQAWQRAAAVILLGVAGIASATVPGSPVREWWNRIREPVPAAAPAIAGRSAPTPPEEVETSPAVATISISPVRHAVRISLVRPDPDARIRVRLSDREQARVEAHGEAAGALLRTSAGSVEVVEAGPGEVQIDLPRGLRRATLLVNGTPYFVKEAREIRILAPNVDTVGAEFLFGVGR